jgi:general secretion pathway protein K
VATSRVRPHRLSRSKHRSESPRPARSRHPSHSRHAGFALIAVIWSLGLITLLGMAVIVGARYRTKLMSSSSSVTAAAITAESAINLGIIATVAAAHDTELKFPLRCRMPGGERVTVTLEQELGKVDLNTASPAVLARLFTALTLDQSMGTRIAGRIAEFREQGGDQTKDKDTRATGKKSDNAGKAGFTTIMQLDQIVGITPLLFRTAQRFVTVRSGRPEPVAESASPALRKALNLGQKPAGPTSDAPVSGNVTFRADVLTLDGTRFIREALVSLGEGGRPFLIREWRHGDIDSSALALPTRSRPDNEVQESSCFRIDAAIRS